MLFGTREKFAIEALYLKTSGTFKYARLQFWFDNAPIGVWEDTSDLAASARWGRDLLKASARRTRPDLDELSTRQVFHELHGRFWESTEYPEHWDRMPYDLDGVGDSSVRDKARVLVVRLANGWDRMILQDYRDDSLKEIELEPGVFDEIVSAYCSWVESLPAVTA